MVRVEPHFPHSSIASRNSGVKVMEEADIDSPGVDLPLAARVSLDPYNSGRSNTPKALIPPVLDARSASEVFEAVVSSNAVNMIDFLGRPFTMLPKPRQAMGAIPAVENADLQVSTAIHAAGLATSLDAPRTVYIPKKMPA